MNGPHPTNHNRFRELDPDYHTPYQRNKRSRGEDYPILLQQDLNDDHIPRYLIITANDKKDSTNKPISEYNVFQVEKGLNYISKEYSDVIELKSGDLLIKVNNLKVAEKFCKATHIDLIPVTISYHKTLNTVKGKIYSKKIINHTEAELLDGLKSRKVIDVQKIMKFENDKLVPTGSAILTFDLIRRPEYFKIGYERVVVHEYIPNPMRCKNCQKLGHTKKFCRNAELCKECGQLNPHNPCDKKFCVNCSVETHTSYDSKCPSFLKHKAVLRIKLKQRCTLREAWKLYNSNPETYEMNVDNRQKLSYADTARNNHKERTDDKHTDKTTANRENERDSTPHLQPDEKPSTSNQVTTNKSKQQPKENEKNTNSTQNKSISIPKKATTSHEQNTNAIPKSNNYKPTKESNEGTMQTENNTQKSQSTMEIDSDIELAVTPKKHSEYTLTLSSPGDVLSPQTHNLYKDYQRRIDETVAKINKSKANISKDANQKSANDDITAKTAKTNKKT